MEPIEQRSDAWRIERLGLITSDDITPIMNGPRSWAALSVRLQKETELRQRCELEGPRSLPPEVNVPAMDWGNTYEPIARGEYELLMETNVIVPPFTRHTEYKFVGGSADGLVIVRGGIEVKCPHKQAEHMARFVSGIPRDHTMQMQFYMWVYDLDWMDYLSLDPRLEGKYRRFIRTVRRDALLIERMEKSVTSFWYWYLGGEAPSQVSNDDVPNIF